jgi:hypothetical protein
VYARSHAAGLAWRLLAFAAFAGTASLAVVLSAHAPGGGLMTEGLLRSERCAVSGTQLGIVTIRGDIELDFTNVSGRPCELRGYPDVTLTQAGITGEATGRLASLVPTVLLRPGGTAHAVAELAASDCRLVAVGGLRVGLPGYPPQTYVPHRLNMCAADREGSALLRVGAIQPGAPLRGDTSPGGHG